MDIGKNIQESFGLYSRNFVTLFLGSLVAGILSVVTLGILAGPLTGGMLILCLKLYRGEKAGWNEIFAHFDQFLPTFLITLLLWAASMVVWVIGSIPVIGWLIQLGAGPAVGLLYVLTIGFIVDKKMQPMEALKLSFSHFSTDMPMLWVLAFLLGILGGIGAILLGIGIILSIPVAFAGFAILYQNLSVKPVIPYKADKKKLQIAGIVLIVLFLAGAVSMASRPSYKRGMNFSNRILSGITGSKVKMDKSGESFSFGGFSVGSSLPDDFPKDIPLYPDAEIGGHISGAGEEGSGSTVTFTSDDDADEIYEFFATKLKDNGWNTETVSIGEMRMLNISKDNRNGVVTINPGDSKTDIIIATSEE